MPIPKEILAVKRPVNSVVISYGAKKQYYAVRQRIGCRNINGRHLPTNGPTIGHIINYQYVPLVNDNFQALNDSSVDLKEWANIMLCEKVFANIIDELTSIYSYNDAIKLYCIAVLRVCEKGLKDYELKEIYETSFLSELYPNVALS